MTLINFKIAVEHSQLRPWLKIRKVSFKTLWDINCSKIYWTCIIQSLGDCPRLSLSKLQHISVRSTFTYNPFGKFTD